MRRLIRKQRGFSLVEVIIALGLLGIVGIALLGALATASSAIIIADQRTTAESLARSQMEYVKNQDYDSINNPPQYTLLSDTPAGYTIEIDAERLDPEGDGNDNDDGLQKLTVTITPPGDIPEKRAITLEDYKVER